MCRLRRKMFRPVDILWLIMDTLLCADFLAPAPSNSAEHLSSLYSTAKLSLFLYVGTPLFLLAAESGRRGVTVVVGVGMAMQRCTLAMFTGSASHCAVAALSLRPLWIASSLSASPKTAARQAHNKKRNVALVV